MNVWFVLSACANYEYRNVKSLQFSCGATTNITHTLNKKQNPELASTISTYDTSADDARKLPEVNKPTMRTIGEENIQLIRHALEKRTFKLYLGR